jgi:hypothetical protein
MYFINLETRVYVTTIYNRTGLAHWWQFINVQISLRNEYTCLTYIDLFLYRRSWLRGLLIVGCECDNVHGSTSTEREDPVVVQPARRMDSICVCTVRTEA